MRVPVTRAVRITQLQQVWHLIKRAQLRMDSMLERKIG